MDEITNKYEMSEEEIEAAVHNWLASSGSHITDQFPGLEPTRIEHCGVTIEFEEDPEEI